MKKLDETKIKITSINVLKTLKDSYSLTELSRFFSLPEPVISRYLNGHVLPRRERAEKIIKKFREDLVNEILRKKIILSEGKVFSLLNILSDSSLMDILGKLVFYEFKNVKIKKILTKETMGIPFALEIAKEFNAKLVVARSKKDLGIDEFLETKRTFKDGTYSYLYVPKHLIKKRDSVLIADDSIRSGSTLRALVNLCRSARANVVGAAFIVSVGKIIQKVGRKFTFPTVCFLNI